jgi:hypothetical protein
VFCSTSRLETLTKEISKLNSEIESFVYNIKTIEEKKVKAIETRDKKKKLLEGFNEFLENIIPEVPTPKAPTATPAESHPKEDEKPQKNKPLVTPSSAWETKPKVVDQTVFVTKIPKQKRKPIVAVTEKDETAKLLKEEEAFSKKLEVYVTSSTSTSTSGESISFSECTKYGEFQLMTKIILRDMFQILNGHIVLESLSKFGIPSKSFIQDNITFDKKDPTGKSPLWKFCCALRSLALDKFCDQDKRNFVEDLLMDKERLICAFETYVLKQQNQGIIDWKFGELIYENA